MSELLNAVDNLTSFILTNEGNLIHRMHEVNELIRIVSKKSKGVPSEIFVVIDDDGDVTCAGTTESEAQRIIDEAEGDYDYVKTYLYAPKAATEQTLAADHNDAK